MAKLEEEQVWAQGEWKSGDINPSGDSCLCVPAAQGRGFETRQCGMSRRNGLFRSGWAVVQNLLFREQEDFLGMGGVKK